MITYELLVFYSIFVQKESTFFYNFILYSLTGFIIYLFYYSCIFTKNFYFNIFTYLLAAMTDMILKLYIDTQ